MAGSGTEVFSPRVGVEQWIEFLNPETTPPPVRLIHPRYRNCPLPTKRDHLNGGNRTEPLKPSTFEIVTACDVERKRFYIELRIKCVTDRASVDVVSKSD